MTARHDAARLPGRRITPAALLLLALIAPALPGCAGARPHAGPGAGTPAPDAAALERDLRALVDAFQGRAGVYARHVATGAEVAVAADELYPTASMVKVPLLVGLYQAAEDGRLALDARLTWDDSLFYESEGDLINKLRPGETVALWQLAVQMIVLSDNTASLWIQGLVGGGAVNEWLAAHGFEGTRVNSRVDGRRGDWERYGWGQSTPREMARLMLMIREGDAVSEAASESMYRLLSRSHWPRGATSVLPATVNVAAKPGAVSAARSEALVVNAPGGDYVLCIMTRDQADTSWSEDNEGEALIRAVSARVWQAFGTGDS